MGNDWITTFMSFVMFCYMGIYIFRGGSQAFNFIYGFMGTIVLTSPITISLSAMVLIKEFRQKRPLKVRKK